MFAQRGSLLEQGYFLTASKAEIMESIYIEIAKALWLSLSDNTLS